MFSFVESFKFPDKDITRRSKVVSRAITKRTLLKAHKTVIALEKNMYFIMKTALTEKTPLPERTLSLHYMSAVLSIARDGYLRRNTLVNHSRGRLLY